MHNFVQEGDDLAPPHAMKQPHVERVAAVIVNWNSFELLQRSLNALAAQTRCFDTVIVMDNASEKAPPTLLHPGLPHLVYAPQSINLGFAQACNLGFDMCEDYDFVALVNPDCELAPEWLAAMLSRARTSGSEYASFASRQMSTENHNIVDGAGDVYHCSGLVWRRFYGRPLSQEVLRCREVFSVCGAAGLYRTASVRAVGGFDEDYFCYLEDIDLGFRLRLRGERCLYVPEAVAFHRGGATTGGRHSSISLYYGHRNLVWAYFKNMPGLFFLLFLPAHLAINVLTVLRFSAVGQGRVLMRAKLDAILGLPRVWRKRAVVQRSRKASLFSLLLQFAIWPRR